ncbi:hypothetical protein [Arenimonas aestuarii]
MIINAADVRDCLDAAREVAQEYRQTEIAGDAPYKTIEGLQRVIANYLNKRVEVRSMDAQKNSVKAFYVAMADGSYRVYLLEGMDYDEERFALAKELFHVVIDEPRCRSINLYDHLEEVFNTFPVNQASCSAAWEVLAQAAAMEFFVPFREREMLIKSSEGNPDFAAAAKRYGVPQLYLESYCTNSSMAYFHAFR